MVVGVLSSWGLLGIPFRNTGGAVLVAVLGGCEGCHAMSHLWDHRGQTGGKFSEVLLNWLVLCPMQFLQ